MQADEWNGTAWATQTAPIPSSAISGELSSVSCTAVNSCLAVGSYEASTGISQTLAERWNGTAWNISSTPNPTGATGSYLSGISCYTATLCTAVGHYVNKSNIDISLIEHYS
jgi:hypothetical protein